MSDVSAPAPAGGAIFTIGHSNHPLARLLELLAAWEIALVVDVRSFPGSRRWPWFGREALGDALAKAGIAYLWMKELGGRRRVPKGDPGGGAWTSPGFRAYASYAAGEEFAHGLERLIEEAALRRTAVMCAEGLWCRCHRRIIADHLLARGLLVRHIMPAGGVAEHRLSGPGAGQGAGQPAPGPAPPERG